MNDNNSGNPIFCLSMDLSRNPPTKIKVGNDIYVWVKVKKNSSRKFITLYCQAKKEIPIKVIGGAKMEIDTEEILDGLETLEQRIHDNDLSPKKLQELRAMLERMEAL